MVFKFIKKNQLFSPDKKKSTLECQVIGFKILFSSYFLTPGW